MDNTPVCEYGILVVCRYQVTNFQAGILLSFSYYSCVGEVIECNDKNNGTEIWGHIDPNKTIEDVEGFCLSSANLKRFPHLPEQFFPNLKAIATENNEITQISNADFSSHQGLKYLSLSGNSITSLNGDIFDGLTKLVSISFDKNLIKHIGHDIKLPTGYVNLNNNKCIQATASSKDEIDAFRLRLLVSCPPQLSQIETELEGRDNLLTRLRDENELTEARVNSLELINEQMRMAFDDVPDEITTASTTTATRTSESASIRTKKYNIPWRGVIPIYDAEIIG